MTFILGMRCSDGLVVCADTLESDGVTKRYRNKLVPIVVGDEWGVIWGGSGPAAVVDKFSDKFKQLVGNDSYDRGSLEIHAEATLQFIRSQYTRPNDQISVALGVYGRPPMKDESGKPFLGAPEFHLYRGWSESSCFSEERDYAVVGMDVTLAECILENTYQRFIKVEEAIQLGVFVTSLMKRYADGVGGETTCYSYFFGDREWKPLLDAKRKQIESNFPANEFLAHVSRYWTDHPKQLSVSEVLEADAELRRRRLSFGQSN